MIRLCIKARGPGKYTRRWKGKDGKWNYEYAKPSSPKKPKLPPHLQAIADEANRRGITFSGKPKKDKDYTVTEVTSDEIFAASDKKKETLAGKKTSGEAQAELRAHYAKLDAVAKEYGIEHEISVLKETYARRPRGMGTSLEIASRADFDNLYKNTAFAMISAGRNPANPEDMKLSDSQIEYRTKQLETDLIQHGYVYTPGDGKYENPEASFMVMIHDADREDMFKIGNKYNQDAVAFNDHGKNSMLMTTGANKGKETMTGSDFYVIDTPSPDDDYYTDIPVAGKKLRFSLKLEDILKKAIRFIVRVGLMKSDTKNGKLSIDKVAEFLRKNPNPEDAELHAWAEANGFNVHKVEELIYHIATESVQNKSKLKKALPVKDRDYSKYDQKQLSLGIEIEKEHTSDEKIAKQIAGDHLDEIPDYYTRLIALEKEAKKATKRS